MSVLLIQWAMKSFYFRPRTAPANDLNSDEVFTVDENLYSLAVEDYDEP